MQVLGVVLVLVCLYFLTPPIFALCAGSLSRFHHTKRMREVFDFFADILYPWRWKTKPWKKQDKKGSMA